jgi:hypothetical protein
VPERTRDQEPLRRRGRLPRHHPEKVKKFSGFIPGIEFDLG